MTTFTTKHLNPMFWQEYGAAIETLADKIRQADIAFDAIAPILRSGGIPGNLLAIRFQITRIIPLQFKYRSDRAIPDQINSMPLRRTPDPLTILICENNTSTGGTARAAVAHLKKLAPHSRLHYGTVAKVFGAPDSFEGVDACYFGVHTNERFLATPAQITQLSLRPGITLFPWETAEHELAEMNHTDRTSL